MLFCFLSARTGEILKDRVPRFICAGIGVWTDGGVDGYCGMNGERLKSARTFGGLAEAGERTSTT